MRRLAALFLLAATPALAAQDAVKGGAPGTNVEMPYLMVPLTGANGKLTGYAYILSRLTATSETGVAAVREKLPFIQDAFVRDINAKSATTPDDLEHVDIAPLEARLLADATRVMGAGKVKLITVCTVQIAELRPVTTQARNEAPDQPAVDAHNNPVKTRCAPEKLP